jgi:hypothetical protein
MRLIVGIAALLWVASPGTGIAQSFELHGSAGPTLVDRGYSLAAGGGLFAGRYVGVLFDVERTHLVSRERITPDRASRFRGGTLTLASAQLRIAPLGRDRVGPYGLVGFAAGVSRPNVNDAFPNPVTNDIRAVFFGGGVQVPLQTGLSLFADGRMMLGSEAGELLAVAPIRAGVAWRF